MPKIEKHIFNRKNLSYVLSKLNPTSIQGYEEKKIIINRWINFIRSGNIYNQKETSLQGTFLNDFFSGVLNYKNKVEYFDEWNLNQEQLTAIDSKFADGSLGFFTKDSEDVRVVIELKDAKTNLDEKQHRHNDIRTPVEQAFSYQHKTGKSCKWIIVSNFIEIRLYHHSSSIDYEVFFIEELENWEHFSRFYYLLSFENLINTDNDSTIDILFKQNEAEEHNISKEFYSVYKKFRLSLFEQIKLNNPNRIEYQQGKKVELASPLAVNEWELILIEKTQKLMDRFIFICFCEDNRLLPEKTLRNLIESTRKSFSSSESKIWNELKGLFHAINFGSPTHNINKFNGGLFADDEILNSLIIKDSIFEELAKITDYDFETDVDVNILGHIFEQSISDIEEIKSGIEGKEFDKKKSKRKKEGIYYTPEYITKYIVENAVGGWLEDRKKELGFYELPELADEDYKSVKRNTKNELQYNDNIRKHIEFWEAYREKLTNIKVLDPACGSGAFLNQAFNFLFAEGQKVNEAIDRLKLSQSSIQFLDRQILTNNLFGVDLNNESVEITKLSLWLKTANRFSELTALDNNIKCGNSLIDDPAVAGDKAFKWEEEFPQVFKNPPNPLQKGEIKENPLLQKGEIKENPLLQKGDIKENPLLEKGDIKENPLLEKGEIKENPLLQKGDIKENPLLEKGDIKENPLLQKPGQATNTPLTKGGGGDFRKPELVYSLYHLPYNPKMVERAKSLRKSMTEPEKKIWLNFLRNFEFRVLRQRPIDNFIVDFYCAELKLVIEIDGDTHFSEDGIEYDENRTSILESYGLKVIRFNNNEIMNNFEGVCYQINLEKERINILNQSPNDGTSEQNFINIEQNNNPNQYSGGFDVIIGNPPWGAKLTKEIVEYIVQNYTEITSGEIDTYVVFILKAIKLLKSNGNLGFIVPDTWLSLQRTYNLRKYIYMNLKIIDIHDRYKPFEDAKDTRSHSIILKKKQIDNYDFHVKVSDSKFNIIKEFNLNSDILSNFGEWNLYKSDSENSIFQKMISHSKTLTELYFIKYGLRTGDNQKYLNENDINGLGLKVARGSHIQRYYFNWIKEFLITKEGLPNSYFEPIALKEKIIIQRIRTNSTDIKSRWLESVLIEDNNFVPLDSTTFIYEKGEYKLKYLLAIISSFLMNYYYKSHYTDVNVKPIYLEKLPIPVISDQQPFIARADIMLEKNKELQEIRNNFLNFVVTKLFSSNSNKKNPPNPLKKGEREVFTTLSKGEQEVITTLSKGEQEVFTTLSKGGQEVIATLSKGEQEVVATLSRGEQEVITTLSKGEQEVFTTLSKGEQEVITTLSKGEQEVITTLSKGEQEVITTLSKGEQEVFTTLSKGGLRGDSIKLSTKLQNWYELDYKDFLAELTKAKVKLSLEDQLAWQSLFEKQRAKALEIKTVIDTTDKEIDRMVYALYGLTEEEIKIVEGKI